MSDTAKLVLLADIGGTNARLALVDGGRLGPVSSFAVADFPAPADLIRAFLHDTSPDVAPTQATIAVAGPVEHGQGWLTNGVWQFDADVLASELAFSRVRLVNDFVALAHSIPRFVANDLHAIGGGTAVKGAPRVIIGSGTGLGMAIFVPVDGGIVLATEGGHVTLPAEDAREIAMLAILRERFGHVSAERVLSGPGLELLYETLRAVDRSAGPPHRAADEITTRALADTCPASLAALQMFCAMLGGFAGNAALTVGARGGVYLAGGIVPRFPDFLVTSDFRERFEAKGRFRQWLSGIPAFIVTHPDPAFPGLMAMLEEEI